ncbi:response regulator [Bradyrhizobium sp. U87765 SZCCT0131]|uniref:hybrid sensor histidine kinase/response regulator n=1 Tax=unclassified Bradyrhizobium TaxID=2631580 RepID=UPI001BA58EA9|nr:response regulator [Bradyrhizobium sp. U87765 SZCCT0131]MBR1259189.1 response regulator [Bradyrhizobium sp. U87765 SZCCT0134]MBR1305330.1 response regulator [Bradyrhizobium sp. U87765 SZCCT0110]MBR1321116.1 response regulator [Bradyrhizobium sp. U87765 SZCCT0109]MBR1350230.1 response regulator [Bradyrhizobium sp. U87765 SZCCT0048]
MAASFLVPLLLFLYVAMLEWTSASRQADERLETNLNILQEHALKVFETIERSIAEVDEVIDGLSDQELIAREPQLHARLGKIAATLPQVQSISVVGADGRLRVTTAGLPAVQLDWSQREYFKALAASDGGTYISQVQTLPGGERPLFYVARRRRTENGAFAGVIVVAVPPDYFDEFYGRIVDVSAHGMAMLLLRADGAVLVRYPVPLGAPGKLPMSAPFTGQIAQAPEKGTYSGVSSFDGQERRVAYRRLANYPLYVLNSVSEAAVRADWLAFLGTHMIFGVPATLLLIAISWLALRRTRALYAEMYARERVEGALRQAQRLEVIGQLTGGIAHDFNNLLMVVMGSADRLRRDLTDPRQIKTVDMIAAAAKRGENLIRHLLTFARRQAITPATVDVTRFLNQMEDVLRGSIKGEIALSVLPPPQPCFARVDAGELELALLNLAVNARDAMPNGGRLTLSAAPMVLSGDAKFDGLSGEFVAFRVIDSGEGMPPDVLARVFEPFFTTKPPGQGTGLGLSQVYGFAKQSGGAIAIDTAPSLGTTITLVIPRVSEIAAAATLPSGDDKPVATPQHSLKAKVLLVEDSEEVAQVSREYLERLGHSVVGVTNGVDALAALSNVRGIDIVLSDIVMPGEMDGLDVARSMRTLFPGIPVILVTGYSASANAARREGFEVLRKPYNVSRIAKAIEAHLIKRTRATASN